MAQQHHFPTATGNSSCGRLAVYVCTYTKYFQQTSNTNLVNLYYGRPLVFTQRRRISLTCGRIWLTWWESDWQLTSCRIFTTNCVLVCMVILLRMHSYTVWPYKYSMYKDNVPTGHFWMLMKTPSKAVSEEVTLTITNALCEDIPVVYRLPEVRMIYCKSQSPTSTLLILKLLCNFD